jgi:hypothetical protein
MVQAWTDIYSNSKILQTFILFAHLGGLLIGAGCAVAADRLTLLAAPGDSHQLKAVSGSHRVVLGGLAAMFVSGVLMFTANFDTYFVSRFFWIKMALIVILLINGVRLTRAEEAARTGSREAWARLRSASFASLFLWVVITLFGAILPNV